MKMKALLLAVVTVCLLSISSGALSAAAPEPDNPPASSRYNIYLKLDGICGESTSDKYANWIELAGVEFGVSNAAAAAAPVKGSGAGAGKPSLDSFEVAKQVDCSSVPLLEYSLSGKHVKNGQIAFVPKTGEGADPILTINLKDVVVAGYRFDDLNETIKLSFAAVEFSYVGQDAAGAKKPPVKGGWNFAKNAKT